MHTRPPIAGAWLRYAAAILISVSIHWLFFRSPWSLRSADAQAHIQLQQGERAVELTLLPSVASQATKPQATQLESPESEPETTIPSPQPEEPVLKKEIPARPPAKQESKTPTMESVEQTGTLQTKGVNAQSTHTIKPIYPRLSNLRHEEGTVVLQVHVSETGKVLDVTTVKSSGFRLLDQAALQAVNKAGFTPAIKNGQPVEDMISLSFTFELTSP